MSKFLSEDEVKKWLAGLGEFDKQNELVLMAVFCALGGIPSSYLDVGSGTGAMINFAKRLGINAWGMDRLPRPEAWLVECDLGQPQDLGITFSLISSIETAEHIAPEYADTFLDTVVRHAKAEAAIVFTAAVPGQNGDGHINCQLPAWWKAKFEARGCDYRADLTTRVKGALANTWYSLRWIEQNAQVFVKR